MRIPVSRLRSPVALLGALLLVLAAVLLPAAPAQAHGQLATSNPLPDTVVRDALPHLELVFTEAPHTKAHFSLTAPNGARVEGAWSHGESRRLDKPVQEYYLVDGRLEPTFYHTGYPALLTVAHWPVTGRSTATWLSVASDGDEVEGELTFDYRGPTGAAPAGWIPPTGGPDPELLTLLAQGRQSRPQGSGSGPTRGADLPAPEQVAAPAPAEEGGGIGPWLIPGIVVAAVVVIVVVAARRRGPAPVAAGRRTPPGGNPRPGGRSGTGKRPRR
jgi:methionine-rich copper-binding protein CopC